MITIHRHDADDQGKKRMRVRLEYAGLIGVAAWFAIAYWLFHR